MQKYHQTQDDKEKVGHAERNKFHTRDISKACNIEGGSLSTR